MFELGLTGKATVICVKTKRKCCLLPLYPREQRLTFYVTFCVAIAKGV